MYGAEREEEEERARSQLIYIIVTCGLRVCSFFPPKNPRVRQIATGWTAAVTVDS